MSDKATRKILMMEDQFTLDDGVLWHFFAHKLRHGKRRLIPLRQLCVPSILKLDILKSFHEQGTSHKCAEALFETIRQKYFWFHLYSDTLLYCKQCRGCFMAKKRTHPNKTPLHCLESCDFFYKILADISGPLKCNSSGNKYCLMVIETLSIYVILIPLKSVSAEAVASTLYTHVFTKHGVCNIILLRGNAFRSTLVKAIAEILKVKQVFGMTARSTTLSQVEQLNKLLYGYLQAVCKKEENWSSHLPTIELGHNHCSVAGSRYFSPYFCLTGRNLTLPVDSKIL